MTSRVGGTSLVCPGELFLVGALTSCMATGSLFPLNGRAPWLWGVRGPSIRLASCRDRKEPLGWARHGLQICRNLSRWSRSCSRPTSLPGEVPFFLPPRPPQPCVYLPLPLSRA